MFIGSREAYALKRQHVAVSSSDRFNIMMINRVILTSMALVPNCCEHLNIICMLVATYGMRSHAYFLKRIKLSAEQMKIHSNLNSLKFCKALFSTEELSTNAEWLVLMHTMEENSG